MGHTEELESKKTHWHGNDNPEVNALCYKDMVASIRSVRVIVLDLCHRTNTEEENNCTA